MPKNLLSGIGKAISRGAKKVGSGIKAIGDKISEKKASAKGSLEKRTKFFNSVKVIDFALQKFNTTSLEDFVDGVSEEA